MTEKQLQEVVRQACKAIGLLHYHTHDARRSEPGFPDCVIVGTHVIFAELKTEKGKLSADQKVWRDRILDAGGDWHLWRPSDWTCDYIRDILVGLK